MSGQRGGTTLVEVLVAIFIMAIGLMTLLTLFPLGALSMAQAIQDTRTGHAAANAQALAEALQLRHDDKVIYEYDANYPSSNHLRDVFIEPLPRGNKGALNKQLPPITNLDGPSYPVIVDPIGRTITTDPIGGVGAGIPPGIPRRTTRYVYGPDATPNNQTNQNRLAYRFDSLLDDLNFTKDGAAGVPVAFSPGPPPKIEREVRYTWAYLLRRPRASDQSVVDINVILFNSRPVQVPLPEHVFPNVAFTPGSTTLDLPYAAGNKPDIKKGNWVLDATMRQGTNPNFTPEPHGYFYRVVGVTDNGGTLTLEFQEPIKGLLSDKTNTTAFKGTLIFMENMVELFGKGAGWKP